jgi:predicted nucleotidyltransferase
MKTVEELKTFLIASFPQSRIYLFGSRARGNASPYSDIDIALESEESLSTLLPYVRMQIEESNLPYKVDLVDLSLAPYLKKIVQEEGIVWH